MDFKELLTNVPLLAKELGLNSMKVKLVLDIMADGKLTKPDLDFKAITSKLNAQGKNPFLFLKGKKGSFFFPNFDLPMLKKDVQARLAAVGKLLKKANDKQKKGLEAQEIFFKTLLDLIRTKKILATYGKVALQNKDNTTKECFMSLEGMVKGEHNSATALANEIESLGVDLTAKNGDILRIYVPNSGNNEEPVIDTEDSGDLAEDTDDSEVGNETDTIDVQALASEARAIIAEYKTFSITEMATVKSEKSAKSVLAASTKGEEIANKFTAWFEQANGQAELEKEITAATKVNTVLKKMLDQLAPKVEEIKNRQGEKSNEALENISSDISEKIAALQREFATEIDSIDGLREKLEGLQFTA